MSEVDMLKDTIGQLMTALEEMTREREDFNKHNQSYIHKIQEAMANERRKYDTLVEEQKIMHDKEMKMMKLELEKFEAENNSMKASWEKLLKSSNEFRIKYDELLMVSTGIKAKFNSVASENKLLKHKLQEAEENLSFFTRDLNKFLKKGFQKLSETIGGNHQTNSSLSHDQTSHSTNQIDPMPHDQSSRTLTNQIDPMTSDMPICQLSSENRMSNGNMTCCPKVKSSSFQGNIKCQICQQEFNSTESMLEHARLCDSW